MDGSVALLLDSNGRIALQRRDSLAPRNPDKLTLFGGHTEPGETPRECIDRELKEETSLALESKDIQELFTATVSIPDGNLKLCVFAVLIGSKTFEVHEGLGYEKYSLQDAISLKDLVEADRQILRFYEDTVNTV